MVSIASQQTVQKVYIAYYGRPADPAGLEYWGNRLDDEAGNLTAIIDAFANSPESQDLYGGLANTAVVELLYQQILGRSPDPAGQAFYVGALNSPASGITPQSIALDVLFGAQNDDITIINNKLQVAETFTSALDVIDEVDGLDEVAGYSGQRAVTEGRALLADIDQNLSSLQTALAEVEPTIDRLVGRINGETYALTASADAITGTDDNDQFLGRNLDNALNSGDVLDGGDGFDTLIAQVEFNAAPRLSNIEKIVNESTANNILDMSYVTGEQEVWARNLQTDDFGGMQRFNNVDLEGVRYFAAENSQVFLDFWFDVPFGGSADTLKLGIQNSASSFDADSADAIEIIDLRVLGGENIAFLEEFTGLESISLSGTGDVQIKVDTGSFTNLSGQLFDGDIHLDVLGSNLNGVAQGGSGNDVLSFDNGNDRLFGNDGNDQLSGFAGNDELFGGSGNDILIGGAGHDVLNGNSGADEFRFAPNQGHDTVQDFNVNGDILALRDGAGISFANSSDGGAGINDLNNADFLSLNNILDTNGQSVTGKLVKLHNSYDGSGIQNTEAASGSYYVLVQNSDVGNAQLWYDEDWSTAAGRELVVDIPGVNASSIAVDDFGVF